MADLAKGLQPPQVGDSSFDAYYYAHCCGDPYTRSDALLKFFDGIADRIVSDIAPASVLDAGCAIGLLVEKLRARGVEAFGMDVSSYAIGQVDPGVRPWCQHGSIAEEFPRNYDLIVSIEVLEHMPVREAEAAIANICRHTGDVIFSSSPLDYKEPTHVNVHPPEYWAAEFARHGLFRDVDFDASYITPWAARFRRRTEPLHRIVRDYERRFWELTIERNDTRSYSMQVQQQLAEQLERIPQLERGVADAQAALAHEHSASEAARREVDRVNALLDARHAELGTMKLAMERAQAAAASATNELAQARDRIFHMERSLFWRARMMVKRLFGGK